MNRRIVLVLLLLLSLVLPASAGIIFGKKNKPNPKERVPELIAIVKTDGDENKRIQAAEELRTYDPAAYPEIVPVLIDVLTNDKKPSVRGEAAQSLGKLRPVAQSAGLALEQTMAKDASMMVRLQARSALLSYRWAGYRSVKKDEMTPPNSKEPPLAEAPEKPRPKTLIRKTSQPRLMPLQPATAKPGPGPNVEPEVSSPPMIITTIPGAKPLPIGPADGPTVKDLPVKEATPAIAPVQQSSKSDGPDLE